MRGGENRVPAPLGGLPFAHGNLAHRRICSAPPGSLRARIIAGLFVANLLFSIGFMLPFWRTDGCAVDPKTGVWCGNCGMIHAIYDPCHL